MNNYLPITNESFYSFYPSFDHRTGDIWRDLPTFGMLGRASVPGIVITPACDLANKKCETVTYLPIISVDEYLISECFRHECWLEMHPIISKLPEFSTIVAPGRYDFLSNEVLEAICRAEVDVKGVRLTDVERRKIAAYEKYVKESRAGVVKLSRIKEFIKKDDMLTYISRLVTNAFKTDVHFLPKDGQPSGLGVIDFHSVVLFRYPLTVPVEVLNLAQHTEPTQWSQIRECKSEKFPVIKQMPVWPIKMLSLQGGFLSDLISRYINMYIRLGSADFSKSAVRAMSKEIGG